MWYYFFNKNIYFLDFDTGFTKDNYKNYIFINCNAGMEKIYNDTPYIIKSPSFLENINSIINDENIIIKYFIIPIRDYKLSSQSRVKNELNYHLYEKVNEVLDVPEGFVNASDEISQILHKVVPGGLVNASDESSQILYYKESISNYIFYMTKYNINTIFIDFDEMIINKKYLFDKLINILNEKNIDFDFFCQIYDDVSKTC